jgi:hypothetical protein
MKTPTVTKTPPTTQALTRALCVLTFLFSLSTAVRGGGDYLSVIVVVAASVAFVLTFSRPAALVLAVVQRTKVQR